MGLGAESVSKFGRLGRSINIWHCVKPIDYLACPIYTMYYKTSNSISLCSSFWSYRQIIMQLNPTRTLSILSGSSQIIDLRGGGRGRRCELSSWGPHYTFKYYTPVKLPSSGHSHFSPVSPTLRLLYLPQRRQAFKQTKTWYFIVLQNKFHCSFVMNSEM